MLISACSHFDKKDASTDAYSLHSLVCRGIRLKYHAASSRIKSRPSSLNNCSDFKIPSSESEATVVFS